jgi:pyrimidine-nucleoside phosphorylase
MRTVDLILKKRHGLELTTEEIRFLVKGFTAGDIPDYQMSAWAMAVCFQGMSARETADLTLAMAESGDRADLSGIRGIKVDKHSTGGVGDKTTLIVGPLVAAVGVPVAKMSGRGLGHTGGTIDKLESIAGFRTELSPEAFIRQVNETGIAVIGQTGNITPADKKLYALRDVTGTVESVPLIASSVMSKKIAAGADAIVLDVKIGSGAFMKTVDDAIRLAQAMVDIGTRVGRETVAVISNMDQPLGYAIGNALEVEEAIATLKGQGPADLRELCLSLGARMVVLGGMAADVDEARRMLEVAVAGGAAFAKFRAFVAAQGGDVRMADDPSLLPKAATVTDAKAARGGRVLAIDAEKVGLAAMLLGAGRETKESRIDPGAGIVLRKKLGDTVAPGEALADLHVGAGREGRAAEAAALLAEAYRIGEPEGGDAAAADIPLILAVVDKNGVTRPA